MKRACVLVSLVVLTACTGIGGEVPQLPPDSGLHPITELRCPRSNCVPFNICDSVFCGDDGRCMHAPTNEGGLCDDHNACTITSFCQAGTCGAGDPVVCPPSDACHVGTCHAPDGACLQSPSPNGSTCDDANACTSATTCTAGVCGGGSPVSCPPPDACHTATCHAPDGACVPAVTPACAVPPAWPADNLLTAQQASSTTAALSWTPATHSVGVYQYAVYQNDVLRFTVAAPTTIATVTGLSAGTEYVFRVEAQDLALVESSNGPAAHFMIADTTGQNGGIDLTAPPRSPTRPSSSIRARMPSRPASTPP